MKSKRSATIWAGGLCNDARRRQEESHVRSHARPRPDARRPRFRQPARTARGGLVDRIGADPYRGLHSLVAAAGLVLIIWGFGRYRAYDWDQIWAACVGALRDRRRDVARLRLGGRLRQQDARKDPRLAAPPSARLGDAVVARASRLERRRGRHAAVRRVFVWSIYGRFALELRGDHGAPPSAAFTKADAIDLVVGAVLWAAMMPCSTPP